MAATTLTERYAPNMHGVLSCYDRIIVRASCAVPGVLEPVRSRGRLLADGQIVSPPRDSAMSNPVSMLLQSPVVTGWRHVLAVRALADLGGRRRDRVSATGAIRKLFAESPVPRATAAPRGPSFGPA